MNYLNDNNVLYQGLFNNATVGLYQTTAKGEIITANSALLKMLKFESLTDLNLHKEYNFYVNKHRRDQFKRLMIEKGEISGFESDWFTKDGEIITVREGARALKNKKGTIIRIDGVVENITALKESLKETKKLSEAVKQSPVSVVITDVLGNIEYANPKVKELTGYQLEELKGQNPRVLSSGEKSSEEYKELWNTITSGKTWYGEFHNKKKNGDLFWEKASISPILDSENNITHFVAVKEDITEQKELLKELKQAKEKAEESDRLKSAFLANMSHEIRTPMNSILGFSELLLNQNLTEDKQERYHEIVNTSGKRLMNLINDIVDVSKIDAHELSLKPAVFNLNKLLDQLQQQFSISPKNKNTTISVVKELNDIDSYINADETRLAQVISNLLENAIKFTHDGTVELGYTIDENKLHFYVKDSGVGINEKDHYHIFERFGQSDNEILKVKEGSGLGLAISKGIVELFGGKIWVESEPYKGATFHFTIPNCIVVPEEKMNINKSIENKVISTTKTILIAEDEESNFWYLEAALDDYPFNLIHVVNGEEAVKEMQTNATIDLIINLSST